MTRLVALLALLLLVPAAAAAGAVRAGTPGPDRLKARGIQPQQINGSGGGDFILGGVAADVLMGETGHETRGALVQQFNAASEAPPFTWILLLGAVLATYVLGLFWYGVLAKGGDE